MKRLILPALFLTLSACAQKGEYPSLNPRPIEAKASGLLAEPDAPAPVARPADPAVTAKVNAALASARAGEVAFNTALGAAQSAVRGAGASGSESWITAQMAVSSLEGARAPVKASLSDLDGLLRATLSGPPSEDLPAIEAAIRSVEAIDARQNDAMTTLLNALSR